MRKVIILVCHPEQHLDLAPAHIREGIHLLQKIKQRRIALENMVVTKRIDMAVTLEATGKTTCFRKSLQNSNVTPPFPSKRICGSQTGEAAAEHCNRGIPY